ncbi:23S rRNA (pseudouridine(1915)-N(3))-methyltransferase RlmH [candidate division KSB1 bacterium]
MKLRLLFLGKTEEMYLKEGILNYLKRLQHYIPVEIIEIPVKHSKKINQAGQKIKDAILINNQIQTNDYLVLLDEHGKQFRSIELANWMQKQMNTGIKNITFVVGGPYGFSDETKSRANLHLSLSVMTFSHQMIRLFFLEQLYRAFTIIRNEPYHNP